MYKTDMKQFMVWCGSIYYPNRGMEDFKKSFDNIESAKEYGSKYIKNNTYSWYYIYDLESKMTWEDYSESG